MAGSPSLDTIVDRNLKGIEFEKQGMTDKAIELYEQNVADEVDTPHPYNRLAVIYRKQKQLDDEIRVLETAIRVLGQRGCNVSSEQKQLAKAKALKPREGDSAEATDVARCPYCNATLDPRPRRKVKCRSCGNTILLRAQYLVTEEQAERIDVQEKLGIDEKKYLELREELAQRFKQTPSERDILWSGWNKQLEMAMKEGAWTTMERIYREQSRFLRDSGHHFFHVLQQVPKCRLHYYQNVGIHMVEVSVAQNACAVCRVLAGKKMSTSQALSESPIPVQECENGFCQCGYAPAEN